jgi:hypothetical protein
MNSDRGLVGNRGRRIKNLVSKIDGGGLTGKKVKAPVRDEWFGSPTADSTSFQSHPDYGCMCPVLKPDVDTP